MADHDQSTPVMTDAYHKARRQFALFSAILLAWEYVGIELGNEATLPVVDPPVTILNSEVIPLVILALVLYFGARLTIEWFQSDPLRRGSPVRSRHGSF